MGYVVIVGKARDATNHTKRIAQMAKNTALARAKESAGKARSALSRYRAEIRKNEVPDALMGSAGVLGGAALAGAAKGQIGDEIMGFPTEVALGLLLAGLGVGTKSRTAIYAGAGSLAPYVAGYTEDMVANLGA